MTGEARIFSVAEARHVLPLVRRITHEVMEAHQRWASLVRTFDAHAAAAVGAADPAVEAAAAAVLEVAGEVERGLAELAALGGVFKGFDGGLVDFYSLRDDRLVFLCWRLGEADLGWWHEVDAGFGGRQPIDEHLLTGTVA